LVGDGSEIGWRWPASGRVIVVLLPVGVAAMLGASGASGNSEPTCFGKKATNPGSLIGTEGDDVIIGTTGNDTIAGLGGDDRICSLEGDDFFSGGPGNDRIVGGPGNDRIGGDFGLRRSGTPTSPPTAETTCCSVAREPTTSPVTTSALLPARSQATAETTRSTVARGPTR
jgi:RTX calcium-binding nonapeptide repeat (4 copies)